MDAPDATQTLRQTVSRADVPSAPDAAEAPRLLPVARARRLPPAPGGEPVTSDRRKPAIRWLLACVKGLATLAIALVAAVAALLIWSTYVTAPWTRDGTVRVQVASVAPQVSGRITELRVGDNEFVHKGDVLYVIDPFDFQVALQTGQAQMQESAAALQVKQAESDRRQRLTSLATTPEEQQTFAGSAVEAKAAFDAAQQQVAQAEINLRRTQVLSPVNGYVTNLLMRVGDYAHQGEANLSVIDTDSYWIDGYFEETKMARVCIGDRIEAKLMGYAQPILGHVATVTRGIGVSNAEAGAQGLPNVDPVYTWVRLAQRVPVRIAIDSVPPGIPLVSGMTATVTVTDADARDDGSWPGRTVTEVRTRLSDLLAGPSARPGCIPAVTSGQGPTESLPADKEEPIPSADQINPGLAPGIDVSPRRN
jgi:multidrug resistance efflux pump